MQVILVITDTIKEADKLESELVKDITVAGICHYTRSFGMVTMHNCSVIFRTVYEINNGKSFGIIPQHIYNYSMHDDLQYVYNMIDLGADEPECKLSKLVSTLEGITYVQGEN